MHVPGEVGATANRKMPRLSRSNLAGEDSLLAHQATCARQRRARRSFTAWNCLRVNPRLCSPWLVRLQGYVNFRAACFLPFKAWQMLG